MHFLPKLSSYNTNHKNSGWTPALYKSNENHVMSQIIQTVYWWKTWAFCLWSNNTAYLTHKYSYVYLNICVCSCPEQKRPQSKHTEPVFFHCKQQANGEINVGQKCYQNWLDGMHFPLQFMQWIDGQMAPHMPFSVLSAIWASVGMTWTTRISII